MDSQNTIIESESIPEWQKKFSKTIRDTISNLENFRDKDISVFVSSTKSDLEEERWAVNKLIEEMGFNLLSMEHFGARPESPLETCLSELDSAKIYVCILGMRYGSVYNKGDISEYKSKSYTEIEYLHILKKYKESNGKTIRIIIYCIDEDNAKIYPKFVDTNENANKLKNFKDRIKEQHHVHLYSNIENLIGQMARDLEYQSHVLLRNYNNIKNNQREEDTHKKSINAQITVTTDTEVAYFHEPLRIMGTAVYTENKNIYLQIYKKKSSTMPTEDELLPMKEDGSKHISVMIDSDFTWSYRWYFNDLIDILEEGEYTLLVTSTSNLSDSNIAYSTNNITLRRGFLTVTTNSDLIIDGVDTWITGVSLTKCPYLYLWLCSYDKLIIRVPISINKDDSYQYSLPSDILNMLTINEEYYCIIQMPRKYDSGNTRIIYNNDNKFIANIDENGNYISSSKIDLGIDNSAPKINQRLIELINKSEDVCVFIVYNYKLPEIIDLKAINNKSNLTISGITNLPQDTEIFVDLKPVNVRPPVSSIISNIGFGQMTSSVKVMSGNKGCSFITTINTSKFPRGQYKLRLNLVSNGKTLSTKDIDI